MTVKRRVRHSSRDLWRIAVTAGILVLVTGCGVNGASSATPTSATGTTSQNAAASTSSQQSQAIKVTADHNLGNILTTRSGMSLYHYTKDSINKSTCTGACAALWPPFIWKGSGTPTGGSGVTGKLGLMERANGSKQVTYNGIPLYTFSGDIAAGQVKGQGYRGWWYAVTPSTTSTAAPASNGAGSTHGSGW
ncbi:COG4315 family predicted lipoprotein [Alicyclobacillus sp. ALC3]|uniref:COG4315 family predicted lipoprotein n=1 Tax=Alicyclobacillus sp. ALC3 TaxID=2796143 RepID=UPI002378809A|nr:hypothetical protein [Alicyclobacillus sp. ALC3]WDL97718.1 hypothetical protein JC200_03020 [Alicyclobacillus sp. ALC3]